MLCRFLILLICRRKRRGGSRRGPGGSEAAGVFGECEVWMGLFG